MAQQNDKWKYCQAELNLPPITRSKWHLNNEVLDFLGLPHNFLKKASAENAQILRQERVLFRKPKVRKAHLNSILSILRRHRIRVKVSPYSLPYDEALIRASF